MNNPESKGSALMWIILIAISLLILVFGWVWKADAQTSMGPMKTPQMNQNIYVGQTGYSTIQSAVTYACKTAPHSFAVTILPGMSPSDSIAAITGGCAGTYIADVRTMPMHYYQWDGTKYNEAQICTNCGGAEGGGLSNQTPGNYVLATTDTLSERSAMLSETGLGSAAVASYGGQQFNLPRINSNIVDDFSGNSGRTLTQRYSVPPASFNYQFPWAMSPNTLNVVWDLPGWYQTGTWTNGAAHNETIWNYAAGIFHQRTTQFFDLGGGDTAHDYTYYWSKGNGFSTSAGDNEYNNMHNAKDWQTLGMVPSGTVVDWTASTGVMHITSDVYGNGQSTWWSERFPILDYTHPVLPAMKMTGVSGASVMTVNGTLTPSTCILDVTGYYDYQNNYVSGNQITLPNGSYGTPVSVNVTATAEAGYTNCSAGFMNIYSTTSEERGSITSISGSGTGPYSLTLALRNSHYPDRSNNYGPRIFQGGTWGYVEITGSANPPTVPGSAPTSGVFFAPGSMDAQTLVYVNQCSGTLCNVYSTVTEPFPEVTTATITSDGASGYATAVLGAGANTVNWNNRTIAITGTTDFNGSFVFTTGPYGSAVGTYTFPWSGGAFNESGTVTWDTGRNVITIFTGCEVYGVHDPQNPTQHGQYASCGATDVNFTAGDKIRQPLAPYAPHSFNFNDQFSDTTYTQGDSMSLHGHGIGDGYWAFNRDNQNHCAATYQGCGGTHTAPGFMIAQGAWSTLLGTAGGAVTAAEGGGVVAGGTAFDLGCAVDYTASFNRCSNPGQGFYLMRWGNAGANYRNGQSAYLYNDEPHSTLHMYNSNLSIDSNALIIGNGAHLELPGSYIRMHNTASMVYNDWATDSYINAIFERGPDGFTMNGSSHNDLQGKLYLNTIRTVANDNSFTYFQTFGGGTTNVAAFGPGADANSGNLQISSRSLYLMDQNFNAFLHCQDGACMFNVPTTIPTLVGTVAGTISPNPVTSSGHKSTATKSTPDNSLQTCRKDAMWHDDDYIYVCVRNHTIKRAALQAFTQAAR